MEAQTQTTLEEEDNLVRNTKKVRRFKAKDGGSLLRDPGDKQEDEDTSHTYQRRKLSFRDTLVAGNIAMEEREDLSDEDVFDDDIT